MLKRLRLNQKGFLPIVGIIVAVLIVGGGVTVGTLSIRNNQEKARLERETQEYQRAKAVLEAKLAEQREAEHLASEAARRIKEEEEKKKLAEEEALLRPAPSGVGATEGQAKKVAALAPVVSDPPVLAATTNNPDDGYSRINVATPVGTFSIDLIKADLSSGVKVLTDSESSSDCTDNCPTTSLANYVSRNGGFAGINGTYFCPPDYASCAGKTNSFHWYLFNSRTRNNLNADKRDYSNAGSVFVFRSGSVQFYRDPQSFGLDTSISGAIASFPTLLSGGQIVLDDSLIDDKQRNTKGNRGGLANKGNVVYLMIAHGASVPDLAQIMKALGLDNGINLDGGGSSALYWYNGYKVGPGRSLLNAIILAR